MYKIILPILLVLLILPPACRQRHGSDDNDRKLRDIRKLMSVYDIEAINFNVMERADTLFRVSGLFPEDSTKRLVYVANGNCSVCIASLINFLSTWERGLVLPEPTLVIKGANDELVKYYLMQQEGNWIGLPRATVPSDIYAQDGAYLIVNGRIINHIPWTIFSDKKSRS